MDEQGVCLQNQVRFCRTWPVPFQHEEFFCMFRAHISGPKRVADLVNRLWASSQDRFEVVFRAGDQVAFCAPGWADGALSMAGSLHVKAVNEWFYRSSGVQRRGLDLQIAPGIKKSTDLAEEGLSES